jgi:hypothetical protein
VALHRSNLKILFKAPRSRNQNGMTRVKEPEKLSAKRM